jgi:hypothetical protein
MDKLRIKTMISIVTSAVMQVAQSFDSTKFNFTKALQKEVLCQFEATLDQFPSYEPLVRITYTIPSPVNTN